ncbi:tryptophanyl-tRNA synthetase [Jackrogersella minutella]|nr:tryptophanyl-tRNA synthetase [Jackrogersella minutella]
MRSTVCARCRPLFGSARRQILRSATRQQRRNESTDTASSYAINNEQEVTKRKDKIVFSGIQPTGIPHLGNYLGALRQWKEMQDDLEASGSNDKLLFSVVDLHALTMPQDAPALLLRRREMIAALLAIGLDPKKGSTIFLQSSVPQHTELMWILSCTASMGYLSRMTQWKSKVSMQHKTTDIGELARDKLKLGLFSYPVLQAADILVHRATHVPVGDDQQQHIEFARECVKNFNYAFEKDVLIRPEIVTAPSPRIMSLSDPESKMSKSAPNHKSRILITSRPSDVRSRLKSAVTDSLGTVNWDPQNRPGVTNLLEIMAQCQPPSPEGKRPTTREMSKNMFGATLKELKDDVAAAVCAELDGIRDRYDDFLHRKGGKWIDEIEAEGAEVARRNAAETMSLVREAVGFGTRPDYISPGPVDEM